MVADAVELISWASVDPHRNRAAVAIAAGGPQVNSPSVEISPIACYSAAVNVGQSCKLQRRQHNCKRTPPARSASRIHVDTTSELALICNYNCTGSIHRRLILISA